MNDREVTIPNEEYRKLLLDSNVLKSLVALRKSWDGYSLVVEINVNLLDRQIREQLVETGLDAEFEIPEVDRWVNPQVYVGFKRQHQEAESDGTDPMA